MTVLEIRDLRRAFGPNVAVDGISFSIGEGDLIDILGPNGAGKPTTIKMLVGFISPNRGEIYYYGKSFFEHPKEIKGGRR